MTVIKANGAAIPLLGLGTWQLRGEACVRLVADALTLGYRHLDTAQMYENEREVGEGLRASGLPRADAFLTTKIWPDRFRDGDLQRSVEESVKKLGTEPDLVLLHWPSADIPLAETMNALADVKRRGLTRHIGVSNFTVALVEEAVRLSSEPIVNNQVEHHLYLDQSKVIDVCRRHGVAVTAYRPIARGDVGSDPTVRAIAEAHGRTPAQIALRWLMQRDVIAIPRTSRVERLKENFGALDVTLSDEDMRRLSALARPDGRGVNPSWAPKWD